MRTKLLVKWPVLLDSSRSLKEKRPHIIGERTSIEELYLEEGIPDATEITMKGKTVLAPRGLRGLYLPPKHK